MIRPVHAGAGCALALVSLSGCASEPSVPAPAAGASIAAPGRAAAQPPATTFIDVAEATGLQFHHFLGATGRYYFPEIMGSGCALLDYDNDGDLDAYFLQGALLEPGKSFEESTYPPRGPLPPRNRLFRNELVSSTGRGGRLAFTDVTEASGAGVTGYGMGAATGDYDNDGDVDIYVTNFGPDVLLRNNGDGTLTDVTSGSGLGDPRWTTSATFADFDGDGLLDLFVTAYCDFTLKNHHDCFLESGALDYCGPKAYAPIPGRLYRNLGKGKFADVTSRTGVDLAYGHGLGVVAADLNADGRTDFYVANDSDENQLWINGGDQFTNEALVSGAALNEFGEPEAGMGIAIADEENDGDLDLFITHLNGEANRLFENNGRGFFDDTTTRRGLGGPSIPFTGFGVGWFDADNDGDQDLFIANGNVKTEEAAAGSPHPYHQRNQLMIRGPGGSYEEAGPEWGEGLKLSETSRGAAFGDVDNDGDIDILVSNNNGPARLLKNGLEDRGSWVTLRVIDARHRRDAIGAEVRLALADGRALIRHVRTDGSYLSANDPRIHFAWRGGAAIREIEVTLAGGGREIIRDVAPGSFATIRAGLPTGRR